jgi:FAD:protein FMN transferase
MKNIQITGKLTLLILTIFLHSCGQKNSEESVVKISGLAQGSSYHISYIDENQRNYKFQIDSILKEIDLSMSTYMDSSTLSKFNQSKDSIVDIDLHIVNVFWKANEIYFNTQGAFDPTVKPILNFWGFGSDKITAWDVIDSAIVQEIVDKIGLEKILLYDKKQNKVVEYLGDKTFEKGSYALVKLDKNIELDFNAIAQGYTVDVIAAFLDKKSIQNYMVEVGGEVITKGKSPRGDNWLIGIDVPKEDESKLGRELQAMISMENQAIATSGNYRKYYIKDGVKYSHTINPKTGFPVQHQLLSATVVAKDCMTADAYATAFMVLGLNHSLALLDELDFLSVYFIYAGENGELKTFISEKLEKNIIEKN